jgi:hypothetical protein
MLQLVKFLPSRLFILVGMICQCFRALSFSCLIYLQPPVASFPSPLRLRVAFYMSWAPLSLPSLVVWHHLRFLFWLKCLAPRAMSQPERPRLPLAAATAFVWSLVRFFFLLTS